MRFGGIAAVVSATLVGVFGVAGCQSCSEPAGSQGITLDAAEGVQPRTERVPDDAAAWIATPEVLAVTNPDHLPEYTGPTGSVEGTVSLIGDPAPVVPNQDFKACPAARAFFEKLFRDQALPCADRVCPRSVADVLVAVTGYNGFVPERRATKKVIIKDCVPQAKTIDLTFGQRIEFQNFDRVMYAPAVIQEKRAAIRALPPNGQSVFVDFRSPGYYAIEDQTLARWLAMDAYVLQFPFHTVTTLDGKYRIDGVPVGHVTVGARLAPIHREATREIDVREGVVERVDLTIEYHVADAAPSQGAPASSPPLH